MLMGESGYACVMQPFSYVSGIPNEANEGSPLHSLGHSISFGRFMTEPLDWDKWSTFSSKRYVEEAERYSKPGSVAQKKAFFEAHYKNIAARKAAALLEKANAIAKENVPEPECQSGITTLDSETMVSSSEMVFYETEEVNKPDRVEALDYNSNGYNSNVANPVTEQPVLDENIEKTEFSAQVFEDKEMEETEPTNGTSQMEELLTKVNEEVFKPSSQKKTTLHSSKLSSPEKTVEPNCSWKDNNETTMNRRAANKRKPTSESFHISVNLTPIKELNIMTATTLKKIDYSKESKDCPSPLRTPTMIPKNQEQKFSSEKKKKRAKTPFNPLVSGSRTTREKWHKLTTDCSKFLSACRNKARYPFSANPFCFTTEERAARRKKRPEEKFNAIETEKEDIETEVKDKTKTEKAKLHTNLCFKARPLSNFYRQRKAPKNETNKVKSLVFS